jgi:cytochrome c oxidase subunit 3
MTPVRTLDASHLRPYEISNRAPLWWGQLLMCFIEASMFFVLIAMYFYIRLSVDMWPPPGTQLPPTTGPTIALLPLLLSCLGSYWASEGAKKNDRRAMLTGMIGNVVLALIFLGFRWVAWQELNFTWATDAHGSIFWSILFLHTLDTVADLLYTIVLLVIIASGRYAEKQRLGIHVDSVVWYFLVAMWLPLYAVIYWGPYWVGAPQ